MIVHTEPIYGFYNGQDPRTFAALALVAALLVLNRRLHRRREAEARNRRNLALYLRSLEEDL